MTTRPATGPGPSTETAREVADLIAARGYPATAEQLRDVADEIDDDHVRQRPDGLWTTEPIPASLAGHITGAQPSETTTDARTPGQIAYGAWLDCAEKGGKLRDIDVAWEAVAAAVVAHHDKATTTGPERAESSKPHAVTYTATIDAKSVARAVAEAVDNLLVLDEEFGREVLLRLTRGAVREDETPSFADVFTASEQGARPDNAQDKGNMFAAPNMFMAPSVMLTEPLTDEAKRLVLADLKKRTDRGRATVMPAPPRVQRRPVIGQFYRLRDDVDRLGVPTDAQRVRVLHITHDGLSAMVDWPDLPDGPAHQSTMIPVSHLVVTP